MAEFASDVQAAGLVDLCDRARACFFNRYEKQASWVVATPGRVNLIGEHVDYNDGFVLPMAIDRYTVIAAGASEVRGMAGVAGKVRLYSEGFDSQEEFGLDELGDRSSTGWSKYVRGVLYGADKQNEVSVEGFDGVIISNIPLGGGLSSSAALEVCTATLVEAMSGQVFDPVEKVLMCQKAEHDFAGTPCGIMDQYITALGKEGCLMLLDCRSNVAKYVEFEGSEVAILIADTRVKHELSEAESPYAKRRASCESVAMKLGVSSLRDADEAMLEAGRGMLSDEEYRRGKHVIGEISRTLKAAAAAEGRDWVRFGELMDASHVSMRDDYEISCDELDVMVDIAHEICMAGGVYGSRMTGGGFGGCTVSLVDVNRLEEVKVQMARGYQERTGIEPMLFSTGAMGGARVVEKPR